jgi:hypothetical protein
MMRVGWHLGNEKAMTGQDWTIIERVPPGSIVLLPSYDLSTQRVTRDDVRCILEIAPGCHVHLRPYVPPSIVVNNEIGKLVDAIKRVQDDWATTIPDGQKHLSLFNEQNMPRGSSSFEGFGSTVDDMVRFNDVFCDVYGRLKAHNPAYRIGFTPLTPGNRDVYMATDTEGVPYYMHGATAAHGQVSEGEIERAIREGPCYEALSICDEYLAHVYIHNEPTAYASDAYGLRWLRYADYFPRPLDVWITEGGFPNRSTLNQYWAGVALLRWLDHLQTYTAPKATLRGVALWILGTHWDSMWYPYGTIRPLVDDLSVWQAGQAVDDAALLAAFADSITARNPDAFLLKRAQEHGLELSGGEHVRAISGQDWVGQWCWDEKSQRHVLLTTRVGHYTGDDLRIVYREA